MRLIDGDALIQKRNHAKNYSPDMYVIGQGYVMDAPTIDAVPVVRCGECKYFMEYRSGFIPEVEKANGDCFIRLMNSGDKQFLAVKYSDYCSYGAKMEDEP